MNSDDSDDPRPRYRDDVLPPEYQDCFGCGDRNPIGIHLEDIRREGEVVRATLRSQVHHQGFPGTLHGGIAAAALDELMSYACVLVSGHWSATAKMEVRFRRPVLPGGVLFLEAGVQKKSTSRFHTWAKLALENGDVAVEATALFLRVPETVLEGLKFPTA